MKECIKVPVISLEGYPTPPAPLSFTEGWVLIRNWTVDEIVERARPLADLLVREMRFLLLPANDDDPMFQGCPYLGFMNYGVLQDYRRELLEREVKRVVLHEHEHCFELELYLK